MMWFEVFADRLAVQGTGLSAVSRKTDPGKRLAQKHKLRP